MGSLFGVLGGSQNRAEVPDRSGAVIERFPTRLQPPRGSAAHAA